MKKKILVQLKLTKQTPTIFPCTNPQNVNCVIINKHEKNADINMSNLRHTYTYCSGVFWTLSNIYVTVCAIWYHLYNLKNVKNTHRKSNILHGYFSRFLNCTNGTKLRNAPHMMNFFHENS